MRTCKVTFSYDGTKITLPYARAANAYASLHELRECICEEFGITAPLLCYTDRYGRTCWIEDEDDLYRAAKNKSLRIRVTGKSSDTSSETTCATSTSSTVSSCTTECDSTVCEGQTCDSKRTQDCYYCEKSIGYGKRYICKYNSDYYSCAHCVPNMRDWQIVCDTDSDSSTFDDSSACMHCHNAIKDMCYIYKQNNAYSLCSNCISKYERSDWSRRATCHSDSHDRVSDYTLAQRFSLHNAKCYRCRTSHIKGPRYIWKKNGRYSLCSDCITHDENRKYHVVLFPWTKRVPCAPLSTCNITSCEEVRHLQMLLTRLGYLTFGDTDQYQGSYQWRTARAVMNFRKAHSIKGGDMEVYNSKTARMLASVVSNRSRS